MMTRKRLSRRSSYQKRGRASICQDLKRFKLVKNATVNKWDMTKGVIYNPLAVSKSLWDLEKYKGVYFVSGQCLYNPDLKSRETMGTTIFDDVKL
jgi:hypothetical protein